MNDVYRNSRRCGELPAQVAHLSANAFQGVVADWRGTQRRVEESAVQINAALARAGVQYSDIERSNAELFRI